VAWYETRCRRVRSFFSAHRIVGVVFGQVHIAIDQTLESWCRETRVHADHAVFDLTTIAVVLPSDSDCVRTALGVARFVDDRDRIGMGVLRGDDLLAAIPQLLFIPLDGFEEAL
jgi:hypothetical protein